MSNCTFYHCTRDLPAKKALGDPLTKDELDHMLNSHSQSIVSVVNTLASTGIVFRRWEQIGMAFYCHCGRRYWTRNGLKKHYKLKCHQAQIPIEQPYFSIVDAREIPVEEYADYSDDNIGEEEVVSTQKSLQTLRPN
jgi:hypothetical protein